MSSSRLLYLQLTGKYVQGQGCHAIVTSLIFNNLVSYLLLLRILAYLPCRLWLEPLISLVH